MKQKLADGTIAVVLYAFASSDSRRVAECVEEAFSTARYGNAKVDSNEAAFGGEDEWFENFKSALTDGVKMIALISPQLVAPFHEREDYFSGIALLSELTYFWDRETSGERGFADTRLIPLVVDCELEYLARNNPEGKEYTILQDAVIPMIASLDPISISAAAFCNDPLTKRNVTDAIARRLGLTIVERQSA